MHPKKEEVSILYAMWKEAFAFDDGGSIDDYFKRNFRIEHCYIIKIEGEIVSCLCAHPHPMILQDKEVPVRFISGVITRKKDRHKGYMQQLFQEVFHEHPSCPLWVLQAYHPEIYTSLGFQNQYIQYTYKIKNAKTYSYPITDSFSTSSMTSLGNAFLSRFDGYFKRDDNWYENYRMEAQALSQSLCGIKKNNILTAYMKYAIEDGIPHIDEIFYQEETQRDALFASLLTSYPYLYVDSFLPLQEELMTTSQVLMIKQGNVETLKNIFPFALTKIEDVYKNTKPLYHYGFW